MKSMFTSAPRARDMVTEPCEKPNCLDILCVECGWEGHGEPKDAPLPIFINHKCRLRTQSVSTSD